MTFFNTVHEYFAFSQTVSWKRQLTRSLHCFVTSIRESAKWFSKECPWELMKAEWQGDLLLALPTSEMVLAFFTDWDLVDRSWWKERERESISWVTWKTSKAHTQDLYHSQRHRASSQVGLESLGEKVSSVGFHAPMRMKTERRTWGTQVSSGAKVFY